MGEIMREVEMDDRPVSRREFRPVADAVKRMEHGMFGSDKYAGEGMVAEHHEMRKKMALFTRLAVAALIGVCGLIGHAVWNRITGKTP